MAQTRPRFSVVTAVYNVARYLPDFIASIEAQTYPADQIELIMVDDGGTDESLDVLQQWAARNPHVTVLTKENGGQGSARNLGMEHATGTWVTYIDPDDTVDPDYFERVAKFIDRNSGTEMVATNRIFFQESLGRLQDGHPLKAMFAAGDVLVNLMDNPDYFHGSAPAAFLKLDLIRKHDLRFDPRVQPNFEDGHFCTRYLIEAVEVPQVGFLHSARYVYRKRADQSSTLQNSVQDYRRYTNVPRHGYLDVLKRGLDRYGFVPEWVQNTVIYELSWYFSAQDAPSGSESAAIGDVADEFVRTLGEIRQLLDPAVIEAFNIRPMKAQWRDVLLHAFTDQNWVSPRVVLSQLDQGRRQVQVIVRYMGEAPDIAYVVGSRRITPQDPKIRAIGYFEHTMMHEQLAWIPANSTFHVEVNGVRAELARGWFGARPMSMTPEGLRLLFGGRKRTGLDVQIDRLTNRIENRPSQQLGHHVWEFAKKSYARRASLRPGDSAVMAAAASSSAKSKYAGAWVLMDRIHDSDDSAEDLFHHLRRHHPEINAWFAVEAGTPDYERLKASGEDRLVAHGSFQWKVLMMHCEKLISSHIDVPVHMPPDILRMRPPSWNFVFLQHGVIKDDLSGWLNEKQLSLFVTSTQAEYESIVQDGSPYVFTAREVKLTGLPRFDRLKALGDATPPDHRDLILITPTWRHWLNKPLAVGSQRRSVQEGFMETEFVQQWLALLNSEELAAVCAERNVKLGFLPHPNLQPALPLFSLPRHVVPLTYEQDVKKLVSRAQCLVTDYSSIAFNAAYIDRPVVYFQFDREKMISGGHVGKVGYFSYDEDGFGPVAQTAGEAAAAIAQIVRSGGVSADEYAARIADTFPNRDGQCCERVTQEILALGKPGRPKMPVEKWQARASTAASMTRRAASETRRVVLRK